MVVGAVYPVPSVCPVKLRVAWLATSVRGGRSAFTRTLKRSSNEPPAASVPPLAASAPDARRATTRRVAASYSAWSSPAASVLVPVPAPVVKRMEPGRNATSAGSVSVARRPVAPSWPVLVPAIVYSRTSPCSTTPPLRSVTVFVGLS